MAKWVARLFGVGAVALMVTIGVVALTAGLSERRDAAALEAPNARFVQVEGTVKTASGIDGRYDMMVRFTTREGEQVETVVWVDADLRFDKGDRVEVEYVTDRPSAARLVEGRAVHPKPWTTILPGVGLLLGAIMLAGAFLWDAVDRRRRPERIESTGRGHLPHAESGG